MLRHNDPIERIIADGLDRAGISYVCPSGLDFYLPSHGIHIEAKQFSTPRTEKQMSREGNVIVVQGRQAASIFANWIAAGKKDE